MKKHLLWIMALVLILGSVRSFAQETSDDPALLNGKMAASIPGLIELNISEAISARGMLEEQQNEIGESTPDTGGALKMLGEKIDTIDQHILVLRELHKGAERAVRQGKQDEAFSLQERANDVLWRVYNIQSRQEQ